MKNTLKVVLADDEALIRLDIREMLTEAGHEVAGEANNGEDAVAMTRALQPDLVIMDVKMRKWMGLQLLNHYRRASGSSTFADSLQSTGDCIAGKKFGCIGIFSEAGS